MKRRILIAENDVMQARLARIYLEQEGYGVVLAEDSRAALHIARTIPLDLVVLDLMLPRVDGVQVYRALLDSANRVPLLVLTTQSTESNVLAALTVGADDYMRKPYSPRALVTRVDALIRHSGYVPTPPAPVIRVDGLVIDAENRWAAFGKARISLTRKEFAILTVLARDFGRVLSRGEIIELTCHVGQVTRTIDVHIMNIRRKCAGRARRSTASRRFTASATVC